MFFPTLFLLVAFVGAAFQIESLAKFESAFGVIRKINFHIDEDDITFCGTYSTRCMARRGYSIKKLYYLYTDPNTESFVMDVRVLFYTDVSCSSEHKVMSMDIKNSISIISRKYHRIEITTANVFLQFYQQIPSTYKCNSKINIKEPYSLKSLVCNNNENRDIFKTIRSSIRKTYPANAFFTSYMFDVTDSSGIQVKLRQISTENCKAIEKVKREKALAIQSMEDSKPDPVEATQQAPIKKTATLADILSAKKQKSKLIRTEAPTEAVELEEPFNVDGVAIAVQEAGLAVQENPLVNMNYHKQFKRSQQSQKIPAKHTIKKEHIVKKKPEDVISYLLYVTETLVTGDPKTRYALQMVTSVMMVGVVLYLLIFGKKRV